MRKSALPALIKGRRTVLRKHNPKTAAEIFAAIDKDRKRLGRFLPWVALTKAPEDTEAFIAASLEKWAARDSFHYALFAAEGGFAGGLGLFNIQWPHDCGEIGYWLSRECEGRGLMSDAVAALESAAFKKGFHRLEIRCDAANGKSAALAARRGYRLDGRLAEDRRIGRRYGDTLIFGKVKRAKPSGA
ncbi:MAG: GNAT family N-acetyltransferase [Alphaproteobacteria bacterium]|nr:GNAT family N-acetyltransferase [Alphaproteobacteria bacterium]MDE2337331.1 GNAT family N-acetyltransferase [Alphaproteobacteria bacterium]